MSIEESNVVDFIGVDKETGKVILTITDHLYWETNSNDHLLLLQDKINTYLRFIESGELLESYPDASGRDVVVEIVGKYPLNSDAENFINQAISAANDAGITLFFKHI